MQELAELIPLPLLVERLPIPPAATLDPILDATVVCVARHGLAKTSVGDVARELQVAPSTVYRKVGSLDNAVLFVLAREGHRLIETMPAGIADVEGARVLTAFLATSIEHFTAHPMVAKILDDADWVGRMVTGRFDELVAQAVEVAAPLLSAAMAMGAIGQQDADQLAQLVIRVCAMCLLAPPPGDLRDALDRLLLPLLQAGTS